MENNDENRNRDWVDEELAVLDPGWTPDFNRGLAELRDRRRARSAHARVWTWSAVAATASLSLIAFPAPRAAAQYCLNCSVALWQNFAASRTTLVHLDPAQARKPAPDFALNDASGRRVQLSSFNGKVVLLNFWATWCGGCKVEIPWFIGFQQTYAGRGFEVLGVSFDEDGWKLVKPFIAAKHLNYPVMISDSHIAALYGGVDALPVTYLIDKAGRIASTHLGVVSKSDYQAEIERLLSEPRP
jgi:peroxiredoxin